MIRVSSLFDFLFYDSYPGVVCSVRLLCVIAIRLIMLFLMSRIRDCCVFALCALGCCDVFVIILFVWSVVVSVYSYVGFSIWFYCVCILSSYLCVLSYDVSHRACFSVWVLFVLFVL